jgi:metallo-beta-lactamase class B
VININKNLFLLIILCILSVAGYAQNKDHKIAISEDLEILPLSEKTLLHISYMTNPSFGRFSCNGLIYINSQEALILDTPHSNDLTKDLITWLLHEYPGIKIKGVVVNHFHNDCMGGLDEIHASGINSYAYKSTIDLAAKDRVTVPQYSFNKKKKLKVGGNKVISQFKGPAHTKDNIVTWIPGENILFGGCMIKSLNSGKGNLSDAVVSEWSDTVKRVKNKFKKIQYVIPGHGPHGGVDLLDYTIQLFAEEIN